MRLEGPLRAILFDVGWTLIYPNPTRQEASEEGLRVLGYSITPEVFETAHRAAMDFYQLRRWLPESVQDIDQFWKDFYTIFAQCADLDDQDLPEPLSRYVKAALQFHLYPETLPVLKELRRRGFRMGVVSNWSKDLPKIMESLGLMKYFDAVVVSDIVGYHKPQPEIFNLALDSLGIPPDAAIHVGDDLEADVEGARRAGIKPLWLDRGLANARNMPNRIHSLEDLL